MADRPIIFSGPMVQALLAGRKSQTRRVLKPQAAGHAYRLATYDPNGAAFFASDDTGTMQKVRLPYATGDRLWVRETVCWVSGWGWRYRADNDDLAEKRETGEVSRWRPSIHMPRWSSRMTLTVTDVRVQRLADLTDEDAIAEGIDVTDELTPSVTYAILWDKMNAKRGFPWKSNPWIVALTFQTELNSATSDQ